MAGKRVATMMVAVSLGTVPVTPQSQDLPWPYCGSDAEPPVYEQFPLPEGGPGFVVPFEPTTDALVPLVRLRSEPISIHELDLEGTEEGFDHTELAEVTLDPPVYSSRDLGLADHDGSFGATIAAHSVLWNAIINAHGAGHEVLLAVSSRWTTGAYGVPFALDATDRKILSPSWGAKPYPPLDGFVAQEPGADPGPDAYADLVVRWNLERDGEAPEELTKRWDEYLAERYGIGVEYPESGTFEYWNAAPPLCRSLHDAPPEILESLDPVEVWVKVPESIRHARDAAICLRIELGSMGCAALDASEDGILRMDGWTDARSRILVQLARMINDGPSWVQRVEIASIDPEAAREGVVVRLDGSLWERAMAEIRLS